MTDQQTPPSSTRTLTEELEVLGKDLVERFKGLIEEGNVRRIIIRNSEGRSLLEIPMTAGAVVGGVLALYSPVIAALATIGALVARLKIEIVREIDDSGDGEAKG